MSRLAKISRALSPPFPGSGFVVPHHTDHISRDDFR